MLFMYIHLCDTIQTCKYNLNYRCLYDLSRLSKLPPVAGHNIVWRCKATEYEQLLPIISWKLIKPSCLIGRLRKCCQPNCSDDSTIIEGLRSRVG